MYEAHALAYIVAALLAFSAAGAGTASAATVDECQAKLTTLRANTAAAETSFSNPNSFANAVAKLDG
jgi:hypothetical protein